MPIRTLVPAIIACMLWLAPIGEARAEASPRAAARSTLARAYMSVDRAYMHAETLDPAQRRRFNRAFDNATAQFFSGDLARAAQSLASLACELAPPEARDGRLYLASLQGVFSPGVMPAGPDPSLALSVGTLFNATRVEAPITLLLAAGGAPPVWRLDLPPGADLPDGLDLSAVARSLRPARYDLLAAIGDSTESIARLEVVSDDPVAAAEEFARRLDALRPADDEMRTAVAAARSRLEILSPDADELLRMLHPLEQTRLEIDGEVASLEAGRDPYRGRTGHLWAMLDLAGTSVALRMYVPKEHATPAPLVIALHGAGGNEHLFPVAYGDGELIRLADEFGFVVVAPSTYQLMAAPRVTRSLIDAVDRWTPIDRDRVYALGHSLGGITASSMARQMRPDLAAACCLAGIAPLPPGPHLAPLLVVGAQFDPIIPVSRIEPVARRLMGEHEPVVFRVSSAEGHTLMVGPALRESVKWLLDRTRDHGAAGAPVEQGR